MSTDDKTTTKVRDRRTKNGSKVKKIVNENSNGMKSKYIMSLDVGTTNVRCFIFNEQFQVISSITEELEILNPKPGYYEIEPENLWQVVVDIMRHAILRAKLQPKQISCLALSIQRGTFVTWNPGTQEYYHNFITWKDLRAHYLVKAWNSSYTLKALNTLAFAGYLLTRSQRLKAASDFHMMDSQVTLRLLHEVQHNARLQKALKKKEARVEFLDSWILYKLRSGNGMKLHIKHISDISSCTATGLFDPFTLQWSPLLCYISGISANILPSVVNNSATDMGVLHAGIFLNWKNISAEEKITWRNVKIPIACSVSDQTASMWGANCMCKGDIKLTLGTGAFLNINTGPCCEVPLPGLYPLVAWQLSPLDTIYCLEAAVHEFGTVIVWAQRCNFFTNVSECAAIAAEVQDTDGVFFIPPLSGNDVKSTCGFIGIKSTTTRSHLVRAILESLVFRLVLLCQRILSTTSYPLHILRVNGGVAQNDFICQMLADTTGLRVERSKNTEASVLGAALIAASNRGLRSQFDSFGHFKKDIDSVFVPNGGEKSIALQDQLQAWTRAKKRFRHWP